MSKEKLIDPFFPLKVEKVQAVESGVLIPRQAIFNANTGNLVSVVSNRYKIVQNDVLVNTFEKYLNDTDVKFSRTGAGCNLTGSRFWANYRFPDIKTNVGEYETEYGSMTDDIELMCDLWNGYGDGISKGMSIGGLRKICLNGLMTKEKLYEWRDSHVGSEEDLLDIFIVNFEMAKEIFYNDLANSWEELTKLDFDKVQAAVVLRSLELGKMYSKKIGYIYQQKLKNDELKTMWDFYNMVTWFTTHVMENRNRRRAIDASIQTSQQLMGSE